MAATVERPDLSGVTDLIGDHAIAPLEIRASLPGRIRSWWLPRRVLAMVLLTPAILVVLLASAGSVLATPTTGGSVLALFFLGFALLQRFGASSACHV